MQKTELIELSGYELDLVAAGGDSCKDRCHDDGDNKTFQIGLVNIDDTTVKVDVL